MRRFSLFVLVPLVLACGQPAYDGPRFTSSQDHFSVAQLDGWSVSREFGSTVFANERTTIAIRSVAREGDWVAERTPELVFPAARRVLEALPGAKQVRQTEVDVGDFEAVSFEVEFRPSQKVEAYERRHVVLVGEHRVFHVMHTGPKGQLHPSEVAFKRMLETLREEG